MSSTLKGVSSDASAPAVDWSMLIIPGLSITMKQVGETALKGD